MTSSRPRQSEAGQSRRERAERLRRQQQAQEKRRRLIGVGILAVVLAALVIAVVIGMRGQDKPTMSGKEIIPATPTGTTTVQKEPAEAENTSDIDGVVAWDTRGYPAPGDPGEGTLDHTHVPGPVQYAVLPPVGGEHNGAWMNAGIYTKPVPNERAVHNLEHGAVWITYDPTLDQAQVDALVDFVEDQSMIEEGNGQANRFLILSPWADDTLPSPIVVSAWGHQLQLEDASDDRLQEFVDTFRHSETYTPEYGSAADGIPVETGGIPAAGGSKLANPAGKLDGQGM